VPATLHAGGAWSQYSPGHYLVDYTFSRYSRAVAARGGVPLRILRTQTTGRLQ